MVPGQVKVHAVVSLTVLVQVQVQVYHLGSVVGPVTRGKMVGVHLVVLAPVLWMIPHRIRIRVLVQAPTLLEGQDQMLVPTRILEPTPVQA
jgi:hypothetical protein